MPAPQVRSMTVIRPTHFYAGQYIERHAERRSDEAWLRAALNSKPAFVPVWRGRVLVARQSEHMAPVLFARAQLREPPRLEEIVFLGEFQGVACFAVALDGEDAPPADGDFLELRTISGELQRDDAGLLGYARAMILWREKHRYCGRCGTATHSINGGHALKCGDEQCGLVQFPRLDPAIIVLVTDGERVLLGRQAAWPADRYSTIAGYVEVGESVEEAVAREVREETGVTIATVAYHASQPWPFPASLMLGFFAHAHNTQIARGDMELEDARWFSREALRGGQIILPPPQAISFDLIETWYDRGVERPLRAEPDVRIASFAQR